MAITPRIPNNKPTKPPKLLAVLALLVAFALPYILVKGFSNHPKEETVHLPQNAERADNLQPKKPVKKTDNEWQIVKPRPGDSMATIFNRLGLTAKNLHEILDKNPHAKALTSIKPGQSLQFLISNNRLKQLKIPLSAIQSLTISLEGDHYKTQITQQKMKSQQNYTTATVSGSLYSTAQRHHIPFKLIRQMTTVLNKQIDFRRSVQAGDRFSFVYEASYVDDKLVAIGDILALSYTNHGKTFQAIRHTNKAGDSDYYTPQGQSLKKAFTRYPLRFSHISSTFALSRYHAILHYRRPHKGIDLAAPIGTPIQATGSGVIVIIGRQNGYGNMIKIRHDQTYSTVYGHMLRFQKGLSRGTRVARGQVIGYVGQSGLATGPHCHYELHVRNQPRNPTTTPLPTAAPLYGRELASFKANGNVMLARLKLFQEGTMVASKA